MSNFNWKYLLTQLSKKLLVSIKEGDTSQISLNISDSDWLGNIGATEAEIQDVEARIGVTLPPSYREFLKVSNGWDNTVWNEGKLYSTKEIDWLCVKDWKWRELNNYVEEDIPSVPDEDYFVYGDEQDCINCRLEYLDTALKISSEFIDGDLYLLIPEVINEQEEWEA